MWTKICGVRDRHNALTVAQLRPDAIGLNFYSRSPRVVAPEAAARIVEALPEDVHPVGVFVNHSVDDVLSNCANCGLETAQIHGDEPPEFLAQVAESAPELQLVKAFRVGDEGLGEVEKYLDACGRLGVSLYACLIDARASGSYGGTGRTAPWRAIADEYRRDQWPNLILAGGLNPQNVAEAIQVVRPWGVDVAGGVETEPGIKDPDLVRRFVEAARNAAV
jgi:phosphoribosylanthranilate isomerase